MFAKRAGMGIALLASSDLASVGFITGVHMRVFLPVAAVCKSPIAALILAFKRFLT